MFLLLDEISDEQDNCNSDNKAVEDLEFDNPTSASVEYSIEVNDVTVKWPSAGENEALTDITFKVESGQLLAIVGRVGAGKVLMWKGVVNKSTLQRLSIIYFIIE